MNTAELRATDLAKATADPEYDVCVRLDGDEEDYLTELRPVSRLAADIIDLGDLDVDLATHEDIGAWYELLDLPVDGDDRDALLILDARIASARERVRIFRLIDDAYGLLSHLTTEEFANGGDRPARLALIAASIGLGICRGRIEETDDDFYNEGVALWSART